MPNVTAIQRITKQLDADPLFHLSLGSKELFHSNFLAWFARRYPTQAQVVFGNGMSRPGASVQTARSKVRREYHHIDLIIELPDFAPLVIENKVFSVPDDEQLKRYTSKALQGSELVLLSLSDPHWPTGVLAVGDRVWRFVSYRQLCELLGSVLDSIDDVFDRGLVQHYIRLVILLDELVDATRIDTVATETEPYDLPRDIIEVLRDDGIRLLAPVEKFRAEQVSHLIAAQLSPVVRSRMLVSSTFTRSSAIVLAFFTLDNEDQLGWEYQNHQWRLALRLPPQRQGRGPVARKAREERARAYLGWFDFSLFHDIVGRDEATTQPTRFEPDTFNHYDPNFVYRYRKASGLTVAQVVSLGTAYLAAAANYVSGQLPD